MGHTSDDVLLADRLLSHWNIVPSPSPGATVNILYSDGNYLNSTLTLHWDGSNWLQVPNPAGANRADV